ncbi:MAG: hypothetical protein WCX46_00840 [Candidatus Paceibacterota bacterium]
MEDDEFYFEIIKEVLENMSLTFYPNSKKDFFRLRSLLNRAFSPDVSTKKESTEEISQILKDNTDKETTFLVTCCFGESQDPTLEGLALYKMFTKDCGGKTIIISSTTLSKEIETIENFCKKELNCFLFRKSAKSLKNNLRKALEIPDHLLFKSLGIFTNLHGFKLVESPEKNEYYFLYYKGEGFENIVQCGGGKVSKDSPDGVFLGAISKESSKERMIVWVKETVNNTVKEYDFIPKPEW